MDRLIDLLQKRAQYMETAKSLYDKCLDKDLNITSQKDHNDLARLIQKINDVGSRINEITEDGKHTGEYIEPIDGVLNFMKHYTGFELNADKQWSKSGPSSCDTRPGWGDRGAAFDKSVKFADRVSTPSHENEYRNLSIGKYIKGIVTGDWKDAPNEMKAMSEGVLGGGGYMVPYVFKFPNY